MKYNYPKSITIKNIDLAFQVTYLAGVTVYGGQRVSSSMNIPEAPSFHHEYSSLACTVEIVDDVHAAIDHIHNYGRYVLFIILLLSV